MADDSDQNQDSNLNGDSEATNPPSSPPVGPFGSQVPPPPPPPQTPPPSPYGQPVQGIPTPPPLPPQQGTYYSNQQGSPVRGPQNDSFATTSMVTGIVGVPLLCCWPIAVVMGIIAMVFGGLSMNKIKKSNGMLGGKGMAIAGLVLGIGIISIALILLIVAIVSDSTDYSYYSG